MKSSRRTFLQHMGLTVALPTLTGLIPSLAMGAGNVRQRFIGVFAPNGAYMPGAINGDWSWDGALAPLASRHRQHVMVCRGLYNGIGFGHDPHWQNVAGFLSCRKIRLDTPPDPPLAGKTLDQYIAEKRQAPIRSLQLGGVYYHTHDVPDHPTYSHEYLNSISWSDRGQPLAPQGNPKELFKRLFSSGGQGSAHIDYLFAKNKSVLDQVFGEAQALAARMPQGYSHRLDSYFQSVRDVEQELATQKCETPMAEPVDFIDPNVKYADRIRLLQKILVGAFSCGLTDTATIMYAPSISGHMTYPELSGQIAHDHHSCAHNGSDPGKVAKLKAVTRMHVGLLADLLTELQRAGLLNDSLVLYGSDMSDGDTHMTNNLPVLLCGAGDDLKFGQEIGAPASARPLSDLHMEVLKLTGVTDIQTFGEGACESSGQSLGIRT